MGLYEVVQSTRFLPFSLSLQRLLRRRGLFRRPHESSFQSGRLRRNPRSLFLQPPRASTKSATRQSLGTGMRLLYRPFEGSAIVVDRSSPHDLPPIVGSPTPKFPDIVSQVGQACASSPTGLSCCSSPRGIEAGPLPTMAVGLDRSARLKRRWSVVSHEIGFQTPRSPPG